MHFKIRRIYDDFLPANRRAIEQIIRITRARIPDMAEDYYESMRSMFRNPIYRKMRYIFFITDDARGDVKGFAQFSFAQDLNFCYLDLMATGSKKGGAGLGSALYERVREEAIHLGAQGLFIECQGDDGRIFKDPAILKQNRARLKFYERYGARPIAGTGYEAHSKKRYDTPYFLLYDPLNVKQDLSQARARKIIKAILERKYEPAPSRREINAVLKSIDDDPICLREPRYSGPIVEESESPEIPEDWKIALYFNENHEIHHIRDRGYVESPVRIRSILDEIEKGDLFVREKARIFPERLIKEVHDPDFIRFFKEITLHLEPGKTLYPDVFPLRGIVKKPKHLISRAGYYSTDIYSPINRNAYYAARRAVDCALSGAQEILAGSRIVYALVRPPGHHAQRNSFGGFCYFNSTAIAANYLSNTGRVAILDLDYHHGNGQQDIFYRRDDVLTISIHGDPDFEYPHFTGFAEERGEAKGEGFNLNIPLPQKVNGKIYERHLRRAIRTIKKFDPDFLIVALGLDTAKGDPTGTWLLEPDDFRNNGDLIGKLGLPTLVIQEGGYDTRILGLNVRQFFTGLWSAIYRTWLPGISQKRK